MPQRGYGYCIHCDAKFDVVWPGDDYPGPGEYVFDCAKCGAAVSFHGDAWTEVEDCGDLPVVRRVDD